MLCTSCGRLKATEGYFEASCERCRMSIYSGSSSGGFDTDTTKQLCGIEEYMRIAQDTKKDFSFAKSIGKWYWFNRGYQHTDSHGPFDTFFEALVDAVEPYLETEE